MIRAGTTGTYGRSGLAPVSSPSMRVTAAASGGERPSGPKKSRLWCRCQLCGLPSHGAYCVGHSWAYGEVRK